MTHLSCLSPATNRTSLPAYWKLLNRDGTMLCGSSLYMPLVLRLNVRQTIRSLSSNASLSHQSFPTSYANQTPKSIYPSFPGLLTLAHIPSNPAIPLITSHLRFPTSSSSQHSPTPPYPSPPSQHYSSDSPCPPHPSSHPRGTQHRYLNPSVESRSSPRCAWR